MTARSVLELRARVRRLIRTFFDARGFLEVDTPVLAAEVLPEAHIDPLAVPLAGGAVRWLQASPELSMKRLLAAGSGPIYQLAPAFRDGERGPQHDVEFQLLEWYEPGSSLADTADLLAALCCEVLGTVGLEPLTCTAAFIAHVGLDPLTATAADWLAAVRRAGLVLPEGIADLPAAEIGDRCFEYALSELVQPRLGHATPTLLEAWPGSQAAFARVDPGPLPAMILSQYPA